MIAVCLERTRSHIRIHVTAMTHTKILSFQLNLIDMCPLCCFSSPVYSRLAFSLADAKHGSRRTHTHIRIGLQNVISRWQRLC